MKTNYWKSCTVERSNTIAKENISIELTQIDNSIREIVSKIEKKSNDISNKVGGLEKHINNTY